MNQLWFGRRMAEFTSNDTVTTKVSCDVIVVVVVYQVTIVAIEHGLLKKFWPLVLGCVLRTAGSSII